LHQGKRVALPRYYRDKIFSAEEREYLNGVATMELDRAFWEEVERIKAFGIERPMEYVSERKQEMHDKIRVKSIKLNTF